MANQMKMKSSESKAALENEIYSELDRIIKRAKDENEALNKVLKNMTAKQDGRKNNK